MSTTEAETSTSVTGRDRLWTRGGAAIGLLSIVITTVGFVMHATLPMAETGTDVATWAAQTNESTFSMGINIELLGYLLFLIFAAWLWSIVRRRANGLDWLSMAGLLAGALFIGASSVDDGIWLALLSSAHAGTDAQALALVREVGEQVFNVSFIFIGLFAILIGSVSWAAGSLAWWVGGAAVALGVATLVPPSALIGSLLLEVWVVVLCLYVLVRPASARREDVALSIRNAA